MTAFEYLGWERIEVANTAEVYGVTYNLDIYT
jgi:hypothetical protein